MGRLAGGGDTGVMGKGVANVEWKIREAVIVVGKNNQTQTGRDQEAVV